MQSLIDHLTQHKATLTGKWLLKNSNYEEDICALLGMTKDTGRYWDAIWGEQRIEFKKGKSIWLDLVRYSEIIMNTNDEILNSTFNLFFIPHTKGTHITDIVGVTTEAILAKLGLEKEMAIVLIDLNKSMPRSLNVQASLTVKDIKEISTFIV